MSWRSHCEANLAFWRAFINLNSSYNSQPTPRFCFFFYSFVQCAWAKTRGSEKHDFVTSQRARYPTLAGSGVHPILCFSPYKLVKGKMRHHFEQGVQKENYYRRAKNQSLINYPLKKQKSCKGWGEKYKSANGKNMRPLIDTKMMSGVLIVILLIIRNTANNRNILN